MQGRRPTLIWSVFAALAVAGIAHAEARSSVSSDGCTVTLFPGERVVVRGVEGGKLALVSAQAGDPASALPPKPGPRGPDAPMPQGAEPGTVALTLGGHGGRTVLKLDSGLEQAFDYRAVLRVGNDERPGSTCTVLPLLASWEEWPYAVASVTLSGFATRPTNEVVCDPPK
jgi:hypothetical protein